MVDKSEIQKIKSQLIKMTTQFCKSNINDEYAELCQRLIDKLARKRTVPFTQGRVEIWAAAVVYTIGTINFLFDKKTKPYASTDSINEYFGTSKSTVGQKSKVIQDMLKIWHFDPEFSTKEMIDKNPLANLAMVNGYIVSLDR